MVNQVKAWGTKLAVLRSEDYGSRVAEDLGWVNSPLWRAEVEFLVFDSEYEMVSFSLGE